ncbi:unnamed protein product [Cuscuta campestris]|uniref:Anamorsin homolog n=1 Tax=Cuscuta campestris TaxID=132261 RepID=A0A484L2L6_9ASTE|nr:unnamed protein product [Cuscuta campestris]
MEKSSSPNRLSSMNSHPQDSAVDSILVLTDDVVVSLSAVHSAVGIVKKAGVEKLDPLIITQASYQSITSVGSSTVDIIVIIFKSSEFPSDQLFVAVTRVLKPGGTVLLKPTSLSATETMLKSTLERKLLLAGFMDVQSLESAQSFGVTGKRPSWNIGSSFSIKKAAKSLPKVQINDDADLIDEDSLLTDEDLKKPQLPTVGDCEVGTTRKACKNCSCGRAELEAKVQLELTTEQINNPQSSCGSCGLGDAFRCGTCPYRGLPPFKLGDKVTLSQNFLEADF